MPDIGDLASIGGLVITIIIYFNLYRIRKEYLFNARIPDLLKKFKKHGKTVSALLNDFDDSKELIQVELRSCRANLKNLKSKIVDRNTKKSIKELDQRIKAVSNNSDFLIKDVWAFYSELNGLIQEVENIREDRIWSNQ